MSIKSDLQFITRAVARKDYAPELCHILIKDGTATAYDGLLSMSTSVDINLHVKPHAKDLMTAVKQIEGKTETLSMHVTPKGRLSINCGKFRAYVDCLPDEADMTPPQPDGPDIVITDELFEAIKAVAPFMATDASRPWAMGVLLRGASAFASNNVIMVERWHGSQFTQDILIPADTITELVKIGQKPTRVQMNDFSVTFWWGEHRWMRSALIDSKWPEPGRLGEMLGRPIEAPFDLKEEFFDALEMITPFANEYSTLVIDTGVVKTSPHEGEGASHEVDTGALAEIGFNINYVKSLKGTAHVIDWNYHPNPCPFKGTKLRGIIIGLIKPQ